MSTNVRQLFDLEGKTALVTGGSRGLGLQIAEALGEAGAKVMLTSRKAEDLEESAAHLKDSGIAAIWLAADLSQASEVVRVAQDATRASVRVDILGATPAAWGAAAEDHPLEAWDKVMNLNVRSIFLMSRRSASTA
jgi:gluconate 5-dehydrogenase